MKDYGFEIAWDDFIRQTEDFVREKGEELSQDLSRQIANAVQSGAKYKLLTRATPKDGSSEFDVQTVANNIIVEDYGDEHIVTVLDDFEGLGMFLEYGTGLAGRDGYHPEAGNIGWQYAINEDNYSFAKAGPSGRRVRGFKYKYSGNYLDENDINPVYMHSVKTVKPSVYVSHTNAYTDKRGRNIPAHDRVIVRKGGHYEYHQYYPQWVLSRGLKPIRYMYDAKSDVSRLINRHKDKPDGYKALKRSLAYYTRTRKLDI